jgi:hypothetical protein
MNHAGWKFASALLALGASLTATGEEYGISFSPGDWEIVCDNTRACRMAGYSSEDANDDERGSVLITRVAGPNAPLEGEATLADYDMQENPSVLTLWIDGQLWGKLNLRGKELVYPLTLAQIRALLAATRNDKEVKFEGEAKSFTLSGAGVSAVLLKMDEFQGRIGTPGALIRKGNKPEESVLPPLPMPVIRAAKVSNAPPRALTVSETAALKPLLLKSKGREEDRECAFDDPESGEVANFDLTPLDARHVLISALCDRGAYNWRYAYWVMDDALKGRPKFVTATANEYAAGMISASFKGGGLGNCWSVEDWVWDGREFRQSAQWHTGMCRGIHMGGTWLLPTFVTKVIREDGSPRSSD